VQPLLQDKPLQKHSPLANLKHRPMPLHLPLLQPPEAAALLVTCWHLRRLLHRLLARVMRWRRRWLRVRPLLCRSASSLPAPRSPLPATAAPTGEAGVLNKPLKETQMCCMQSAWAVQ
jgi:hypothetical protein